MTRIEDHFARTRPAKSLVGFITAGDPTLDHTVPAMHALVAGGTDLIELGIPFSDPEAEGPAIQASSERALANQVTLNTVLDFVAEFRKENSTTPIILMGYLNSVLAHPDFAGAAQTAGVDGLIMVNLPPEEGNDLATRLREHNMDLIYLLAPTTTDKRAELILQKASGFVYYVSLKGITGASHLDAGDVAARMAQLKAGTDLPICVGFGIKDRNTAAQIAPHADGVVVGSALVNLLAEHEDDVQAACQAITSAAYELRQGVDAPSD
ncbi:MAG: tryptophan synthase subunit alpha [Pseudomonadota bacterium]